MKIFNILLIYISRRVVTALCRPNALIARKVLSSKIKEAGHTYIHTYITPAYIYTHVFLLLYIQLYIVKLALSFTVYLC